MQSYYTENSEYNVSYYAAPSPPDVTSFQAVDGDILLTPAQWKMRLSAVSQSSVRQLAVSQSNVRQRAVVNTENAVWTGGIIPYEISVELSKLNCNTTIIAPTFLWLCTCSVNI